MNVCSGLLSVSEEMAEVGSGPSREAPKTPEKARRTYRSGERKIIEKVVKSCEVEKENKVLLHPISHAVDRASAYTGASISTIRRIKMQRAKDPSQSPETPGKKEIINFTMPPKKPYIGRYDGNAKRAREKRKLETPDEREIRRKKDRERTAKFRASETVQQRETRLQIQRARTANYRALKKDRQRRTRLQDEKSSAPISRASKTAQRSESQLLDRLVKLEPVDNTDEGSWKTNEELENPATVFVKTEWECEIQERFQENEETQDEKEEELEPPTTVFSKTETVCDIEEAFQEENNEESWEEKAFHVKEASQDEEEEVLEPPESVFLVPTVCDEENSKPKEDPLAPSSGSEFLASIRQKIGALSARWRDRQENQELLENF